MKKVQSVSSGAQIQVRRFDKTTVEGRFVSADGSTLTMSSAGGEMSRFLILKGVHPRHVSTVPLRNLVGGRLIG